MTAVATAGRPVVLVVEDKPDELRQMTDGLARFECTPIGVSTHDEAVRELRAAPAIDLVLTDVNLAAPRGDKSGVSLARYIRRTYVDLPIAGYSAHFEDKQLRSSDKRAFEQFWTKSAGYREVDEMMRFCRDRALRHRRERQARASETRSILRGRGGRESLGHELMRDLRPGTGDAAPVEEALSRAGYRLKVVESDTSRLLESIIVWLLEIEGRVEAEVYGQPALYADGKDDEEAIARLLDLMHLYRAELERGGEDSIGPARSLSEFLRKVLDDEPPEA